MIASPANPTGTMMDADALYATRSSVAEAEGIRVISDEIYHGLDYAFAAETAADISERAVVINSFSKYFCMTGWRIGWMVVPENLVRTIDRLQGNLAISVPTLAQVAGEAAFDGREEMEAGRSTVTRRTAEFCATDCRKPGSTNFCRWMARSISTRTSQDFPDDSLDFRETYAERGRRRSNSGHRFRSKQRSTFPALLLRGLRHRDA